MLTQDLDQIISIWHIAVADFGKALALVVIVPLSGFESRQRQERKWTLRWHPAQKVPQRLTKQDVSGRPAHDS